MKWVLPKFLDFFLIIIFIFLSPQIITHDFWHHLKVGEYTYNNLSPLSKDIFSYTAYGKDWVAHSWLTEFLFYFFYKIGGLKADLLFGFSLIIITLYLLYYFLIEINKNRFISFSLTLFSFIVTFKLWILRPHLFSFLFYLLFLFIFYQFKYKNKIKVIYLYPLIIVIWCNLHAGFIIGIVTVLIFIGGEFIERKFNKNRILLLNDSQLKKLILVLFLMLLASLINPQSYKIFGYIFSYLHETSIYKSVIDEWKPPTFESFPYLGIYLILLISFLAISSKKLEVPLFLLLIFMTYFGLTAMRNIPFFILTATPIMSYLIIGIREDNLKLFLKFIIVLLLFIIFSNLSISNIKNVKLTFDDYYLNDSRYPYNAVKFIKENHIKGKMFNSYRWGGYLIWTLWPDYQVFIDGRTDLYGWDIYPDYAEVYFFRPNWKSILEKWGIDFILIENNIHYTRLPVLLNESQDWKLIYKDDIALIYKK